MKFPIKKVDGNELTNRNGKISYVYEVCPPDLEQFDSDEIKNFLLNLKSSLQALDEQKFYKFYTMRNNIYLNTNDEHVQFSDIELERCKDPFLVQFGEQGFVSDIQIQDDYINFNMGYSRYVNIYEMTSANIDLCEFPKFSDEIIINIRKISTEKAKRRLNHKRKIHFANLGQSLRNIESENSHSESEQILEDLICGNDTLFEFEAWLKINAQTKEELDERTWQVVRELRDKEYTPYVESVGLDKIFFHSIMGVAPIWKRVHPCPTSILLNLLPLTKDHFMDEGYEFFARSLFEIKFKIFDSKSANFNSIFSGQSGSGKSMLANKIVFEELQQGVKAVVLDLGNSFKKSVLYNGGSILSDAINPMQFPNTQYLKEFIVSVIPEREISKKIEGKLVKEIRGCLDNGVQSFRELIWILTASIGDLDLYFEELWPYITDEKIDIHDLTYVDTSLYPEKIKAPLFIFLIEYFKNIEGQKLFVFDECWHLLQKNADYISECFRTFRKMGAGAMAISQNLDDFLSTDLGRVIAASSHYKFIFRQPIFDRVFLTDHDVGIIDTLTTAKGRYSEVYLKTDINKKVFRYYPSPLEYELFTSDKQDNARIDEYLNNASDLLSYRDRFDRWVGSEYES